MAIISVLGAGTWGMALARLYSMNGHDVIVWSALNEEIETLKTTHRHPNLPFMDIPESIRYTTDIKEALINEEVIVIAVSSPFIRSIVKQMSPYIHENQLIVCVSKGIEKGSLMGLSEVIKDEIKSFSKIEKTDVAILSGPTHAEEVAQDMPTAIVAACTDIDKAIYIQSITANKNMAVYTSTDVLGVEICGAVKNVIALAAGTIRGLGFGDNLMAALITRGMEEISRLGVAMGADKRTFFGLAGIGDLIVTAMSEHSRNNRCGQLIGQGKTLKEAQEEIGMVVEGVNALPSVIALAKKYDVSLPIVFAVNEVLFNGKSPEDATQELMLVERGLEY